MCTVDNDELSRKGRADQGTHETEVSFGGRKDLPRIKYMCTKNPGHKQFIYVDDLCLGHLPEEYQDPDILELIKLYAFLTVCLSVNYTSLSRPSTLPKSDKPFPFVNLKGTAGNRLGTGTIELIHNYDESNCNKTCICKQCQESGDPKKEWGKLIVQTANHVIFNEEECAKTDIELFYDSEDRTNVYTLQGSVKDTDVNSDWCLIYCPTHDMELVNKLQDYQHHFEQLRKKVFEKYKSQKPKLVVIASHPHGCCKHITIGQVTARDIMGDPKYTRYSYTTATCPGCSGARVWILSEHDECKWVCHLHSEGLPFGINRSGVAWY